MMFTISNQSSFTRSTAELAISANPSAHTDISKPTSMDLSTKWIQCACPCINVYSLNGRSYGQRESPPPRLPRTLWRNEGRAFVKLLYLLSHLHFTTSEHYKKTLIFDSTNILWILSRHPSTISMYAYTLQLR